MMTMLETATRQAVFPYLGASWQRFTFKLSKKKKPVKPALSLKIVKEKEND